MSCLFMSSPIYTTTTTTRRSYMVPSPRRVSICSSSAAAFFKYNTHNFPRLTGGGVDGGGGKKPPRCLTCGTPSGGKDDDKDKCNVKGVEHYMPTILFLAVIYVAWEDRRMQKREKEIKVMDTRMEETRKMLNDLFTTQMKNCELSTTQMVEEKDK